MAALVHLLMTTHTSQAPAPQSGFLMQLRNVVQGTDEVIFNRMSFLIKPLLLLSAGLSHIRLNNRGRSFTPIEQGTAEAAVTNAAC